MPLSNAEKQQRHRERKKAKLGEDEYRRQAAELQRLRRKKNPDAVRVYERQKKQRQKATREQSTADAYSTPSSLTRATKRIADSLPKSPRKRRKVMDNLNQQEGIPVLTPDPTPEKERPPPVNKIPDDVKQRVHDFYLRDDNCYMAPGRKDSITVIRDGQKVKEQRRYMIMSISELYELYKQEYPDDRIKLTKFKSLRPDVVLCKSATPHNVCTCTYHENVNLLLQSLSPMGMPSNHRDLMQHMSCDINNEDCMLNNCDYCKQKTSVDNLCEYVDGHLGDNIKWCEWIRSEDNKTEKVQREGTVFDAVTALSEKVPEFKTHFFVKQKQAEILKKNIDDKRPGHATFQFDFSENPTILEQDEVQSAHWTHGQATLFTARAWTPDGDFSYGVISDNLSHDKYSAATYMERVIEDTQSRMTSKLTEIDIHTDGAAQHFKSRYMFLYISRLMAKKGIKVNWHFSATSHGKGAVDGIGGALKRAVWNAIKSRCYRVTTPIEYADCARRVTTNIIIIFIPSAEIDAKRPELATMWENVVPVPATQSVHCVRVLAYGRITVSPYSQKSGVEHYLLPAATATQASTRASVPDQTTGPASAVSSVIRVSAGKWYAVYWEPTKYWYIGEALREHETTEDCWYFSFLKQTGPSANSFKPAKDIEPVPTDNVFAEVESPAPSSSTRTSLLKLLPRDFKAVRQAFKDQPK